jgi:hypothetical protein
MSEQQEFPDWIKHEMKYDDLSHIIKNAGEPIHFSTQYKKTGNNLVIGNHQEYYRACLSSFINWAHHWSKFLVEINQEHDSEADFDDFLLGNMYQVQTFVLGTQVFEAAINDYGKVHHNKLPYVEKFERRMGTVLKWEFYYDTVTGKKLNGDILGRLKNLKNLRDELVHPKPSMHADAAICRNIEIAGLSMGSYLLNSIGSSLKLLYDSSDPKDLNFVDIVMFEHEQKWTPKYRIGIGNQDAEYSAISYGFDDEE